MINKFDVPGLIFKDQPVVTFGIDGMGLDSVDKDGEAYLYTITLWNQAGKEVGTKKINPLKKVSLFFDITRLKPGKYNVQLKVVDKGGEVIASETKKMALVKAF